MGGMLAAGALGAATGAGSSDDDKKKKQKQNIQDAIQKYQHKPKQMPDSSPASAKRGARKVKKAGRMKVHLGERVLTSKQAKKLASKGLSPADVAKHGKSKKKGRSRKGRSKSR